MVEPVNIVPSPPLDTEHTREGARLGNTAANRLMSDPVGAVRDGASWVAEQAGNGLEAGRRMIDSAWNRATGGDSNANDNETETVEGTDGQGNRREGQQNRRTGRTNWGGIAGGIGGVILAYLASSMFGGGIMGTIAFLFLGVMGFMMGQSFGSRNLNGLFGGQNDGASRDQGRGRSRERDGSEERETGRDGEERGRGSERTPYEPVNGTGRSESMRDRVLELNDKVDALSRILDRQLSSGNLRPRDVRRSQERVGQIVTLRDQMMAVYREDMTAEETQAVSELYRNTNQQLEALMRDNQPLRGDILAEMAIARRGGTRSGPSFSGRVDTGISPTLLTPEARRTVEDLRSTTQYEPTTAQLDTREAPRFTTPPSELALRLARQ